MRFVHFQRLCLIVLLCIFGQTLFAQTNRISLLSNYELNTNKYIAYLKKAETAVFDSIKAKKIIANKPALLNFIFQFENKEWEIILQKSNPLSSGFFATTGKDPNQNFMYENTVVHYKGYIKDKPHSFAAISIMGDKMVAVIADERGNINIGAVNNKEAQLNVEHIIYRENDLLIKNEFECGTDDSQTVNNPITLFPAQAATTAVVNAEPVDVYFEADYQTYLNNGASINNTLNYITALFNVVKLMYENDSIDVQISAIKVWDTADPYNTLTTSSNVLSAFSTNMSIGFPGDIAHFLSQRSIGGGIAFLNTICNINSQKTAVSGSLTNSFSAFPVYSWPVMVITHEIGHNLGSPHTQSCTWPGGALDNCYATEGGCAPGPAPVNGGTVMSYCYLTGYGVNLSNGFGPLPGKKIRDIIRNNSCLNPSIYFETTSQIINEENADVENGCFDYKLVTTKLKIPYAPSQPVDVMLQPTGSAGLVVNTNGDVEVSPLNFTLNAANLSQTINFKVYNDAEIEMPEMLNLNFDIDANGGNAIKRNINISHTLLITSDDHKPDSTPNILLYYEPFNNVISGLGSWTQTINYGLQSPNRWVIGNSGDAEFSTKAAYVSNNGGSLTYSGSVLNDSSIIRLESPVINTLGFTDMHLQYQYKCNGEYSFVNNGANGSGFEYKDYGKIYLSADNGNTWSLIKDNIVAVFQKRTDDILLPAYANNNASVKLAFEWRNNSSIVNNFPLIIDSIVIKGTGASAIQTIPDVGNADEEYLGPNQTIHYYNPVTKNIMVTIENQSSFDFGCTKVELIRTGNSAALAFGTLNSNKVSDKVYKITPGNLNGAAPYNLKLYYTDEEINGWLAITGNSINDIAIVKNDGDLTTPLLTTAANFSSINSNQNFAATPHTIVNAVFTGFGTYAIMKPYGEPACPATLYGFGTNIIGSNYQWQQNNGSGYTNLSNDAVYIGVNTDSLKLTSSPRSFFGNRYRCQIVTAYGTVYSPEYILKAGMKWLGTQSSVWENPLNWSCNMVPDDKTDVTIDSGTPFSPELNASTTIRSLTALSGTSILIKNGAVLSLVYQ